MAYRNTYYISRLLSASDKNACNTNLLKEIKIGIKAFFITTINVDEYRGGKISGPTFKLNWFKLIWQHRYVFTRVRIIKVNNQD